MGTKGKAAIIVGICSLAFMSGLCAGFLRSRTKAEEALPSEDVSAQTNAAEFIIPVMETEAVSEKADYYLIRLKGNEIVIYEVYHNGTKNEIDRIDIVRASFRKEDIELLTEGIKAYSREEAMILCEDFVS